MAKSYKMNNVHIKELNPEQQELNFILLVEKKYASEVYYEMKDLPFIQTVEVETL
jgi:putative Mg2+ transporter-C (MgtC) family protein